MNNVTFGTFIFLLNYLYGSASNGYYLICIFYQNKCIFPLTRKFISLSFISYVEKIKALGNHLHVSL